VLWLGYPQQHGAFEVDHLIPLELGGDNVIANLWPEAA
jgi:5-methylcytosine-specific restriction endonuclease McrA